MVWWIEETDYMRIRVAIVEDDPLFLRQAAAFVEIFSEQTGRDFSVTTYNSAVTFLKDFNANFDILLLDILMPNQNGIEVAHIVRQSDEKVVILFITSTPQYAIKGYTVNALSYLLKPLSWTAFETEFSRAVEHVLTKERPAIVLRSGSRYYQIPHHNINYIESRQHKIFVHTNDRGITVPYTLSALENRLTTAGFYRINSYYLVNIAHVEAIEGQNCVLDTGEELKISRARKKGFIEALTRHLSDNGES